MRGAAQQQPAYVLHRRPYRETSLMVDVFALEAGRLTLVARGANAPRSPLKAQLQPFQPLLLDWQGRGELKTLTQTETRAGPVLARTDALYSGLYINELLQRLLPVADPQPELFAAYIDTLEQLAAGADLEPVLRRFEAAFADAMGLSFHWGMATDTGEAVAPGRDYGYDPEQGIVTTAVSHARLRDLPGQVLLDLAAGDLESPASRRLAKRVMRTLIDHLLQGRTLNSRALFRQGRGEHP